MTGRIRHYGWHVSPYSAKTRAYFQWKGLPFDDIHPTLRTLLGRIRPAVGWAVMPTVQDEDDRWLQDTSEIIDHFEARHPEPSITPEGPRQRLSSLLLELHGDEWLPMVALYYRWDLPENARFALREFGREGIPWLPSFLSAALVQPAAKKMAGYKKPLGVSPATIPGIELFTETLIAHLEAHLVDYPYLLGSRPCLGDFALFGPLWAHLFRDPGSTRLFASAPSVKAWFNRLLNPAERPGAFLPDDEVPETLEPILATLFAEQFPFVRSLAEAIDRYCADHPEASRVPRSLGEAPFVVGGTRGTRKLITFSWWMAQRPIDAFHSMDQAQQAVVEPWLHRIGGESFSDIAVRNRFVRHNFKMSLDRAQGNPV